MDYTTSGCRCGGGIPFFKVPQIQNTKDSNSLLHASIVCACVWHYKCIAPTHQSEEITHYPSQDFTALSHVYSTACTDPSHANTSNGNNYSKQN